ncbi:GlsB/YeaQ/YmgE family stress response membrane protein [Roseibium sp.]|uniref:GlsB/YeaQ/YmgE family stress response membrane protein n=1 Tax=Roseibium sp. TaxID=1936156 RepID=UPI003D106541
MGWIITIIIGLVAGAIAHRVLNSRGGFLGSLVVGLVGALVGGELAHLLNLNVTGGLLDRLIVAVLGSILFLFLWRKVFK